jgi:hypothetical protein
MAISDSVNYEITVGSSSTIIARGLSVVTFKKFDAKSGNPGVSHTLIYYTQVDSRYTLSTTF